MSQITEQSSTNSEFNARAEELQLELEVERVRAEELRGQIEVLEFEVSEIERTPAIEFAQRSKQATVATAVVDCVRGEVVEPAVDPVVVERTLPVETNGEARELDVEAAVNEVFVDALGHADKPDVIAEPITPKTPTANVEETSHGWLEMIDEMILCAKYGGPTLGKGKPFGMVNRNFILHEQIANKLPVFVGRHADRLRDIDRLDYTFMQGPAVLAYWILKPIVHSKGYMVVFDPIKEDHQAPRLISEISFFRGCYCFRENHMYRLGDVVYAYEHLDGVTSKSTWQVTHVKLDADLNECTLAFLE